MLPCLTAVQLQPTIHRHLHHRHESEPKCVSVLPRHHPLHGFFSVRPPHSSDPLSSGAGKTHGSEGDQEPHSLFSQDNLIPIFLLQILCNRQALRQEQGHRRSLPHHATRVAHAQDPPDLTAALVQVHLGQHRALTPCSEQPPGPPAEPWQPPACSAPRSLNIPSPSLLL